MHYLIECFIDTEAREKINKLRPDHLEYINKNKESIAFGGIITNEDGEYQRIIYNYSCHKESEAHDFVKGDPYYEIFNKIVVSLFNQKI